VRQLLRLYPASPDLRQLGASAQLDVGPARCADGQGSHPRFPKKLLRIFLTAKTGAVENN
jgi:hypothetical protein